MKNLAEASIVEVRKSLYMSQENRIAAAITGGLFSQLPVSPQEVKSVIDPNFEYRYASLTRRILYNGLIDRAERDKVYTTATEAARAALGNLCYVANEYTSHHMETQQPIAEVVSLRRPTLAEAPTVLAA